jgi:SAM-dependent methyltransferase
MVGLAWLRRALKAQHQWEEDINSIRRARIEPRFAAPYVPTPRDIAKEMLSFADVKRGDVVYDLGCGDGRLLMTAAIEYGARGVGVEIRGDLVEMALKAIREAGVGDLVRVIHGDMFEQDLNEATVVTLYLLSTVNVHLRPKLENELRRGARVVCHDFGIEGWEPLATRTVGGHVMRHTLYLYRI